MVFIFDLPIFNIMDYRIILCGLMLVGLVAFSGCIGEDKVVTKTIITYQCFDGSLVSDINECPQASGSATVTSETPDTTDCPACNCPKTTCPVCPKTGVVTGPTTTSTLPCDPCSKDLDCGNPYVDYTCKSGDYYKISYTPSCSDKGCCRMMASSPSISEQCGEDETCKSDQGCVTSQQEDE